MDTETVSTLLNEKYMRILTILALPLFFICASCSTTNQNTQTEHVLFVGNSLTFVGNTPAVYSALAKDNGHSVISEMIVEGGATLTERVADESVARALATKKYKVLILQERGGDLMCTFGPDSCIDSQKSIKILTNLAKKQGLDVFLLGTYQLHADVSKNLVELESKVAQEAGISYLEISEKLQDLRNTFPEMQWLASDGMHPGKDLALLNAVLVYQSLHYSLPEIKQLDVLAPIYKSKSGLTSTLRKSDAPPPLSDTQNEVFYQSDTLKKIITAVSANP